MNSKKDLTQAEKKLLSRSLKTAQAGSSLEMSIQKEIWIQKIRKRRVAAKLRQRIVQSALKMTNVDQAAIAQRQDSDRRAALAHLAALKPKLNARAQAVKKEHLNSIAMLKSVAKSGGLPRIMPSGTPPPPHDPGTPPPEITILTTADSVTVATGEGSTSITPWNNVLKIEVAAHDHDGEILKGPEPDVSVDGIRCDFTFLYRPSRSGVLHVWTWIAQNGFLAWATDNQCELVSWVITSASASVVIQQPSLSTINKISLPEQTLGKPVNINSTFNCSSDYGTNIYDQLLVFETSAMELPVVSDAPVQIIVSVILNCIAADSFCTFDFNTGDRQINVPAVILNLF